MARDHRKLKVFGMADALVLEVYRCTDARYAELLRALQGLIDAFERNAPARLSG